MEEKLQRTLGEVIREARERLGLTQAEVAKKVGLVTGVYGRIERGDMMPSVPSLWRLCLVLGMSSDVVLDLDSTRVATRMNKAPSSEEKLVPELRSVIHELQTWPPKRLEVLGEVLRVIAASDAD